MTKKYQKVKKIQGQRTRRPSSMDFRTALNFQLFILYNFIERNLELETKSALIPSDSVEKIVYVSVLLATEEGSISIFRNLVNFLKKNL